MGPYAGTGTDEDDLPVVPGYVYIDEAPSAAATQPTHKAVLTEATGEEILTKTEIARQYALAAMAERQGMREDEALRGYDENVIYNPDDYTVTVEITLDGLTTRHTMPVNKKS